MDQVAFRLPCLKELSVVPNVYSCLSREIIEKASAEEILEWAESKEKPDDETAVAKARDKLLKDITENEDLKGRALNTFVAKLHDLNLVRAPGWWAMWKARQAERRWSRSNIEDKVRNHALLSKARHQLKHLKWSQQARKDVEVYELIDVEGFIPFMKAFQPSVAPDERDQKASA